MLHTVDEIKRQARENGFNSFHFSLSGGEPTFHPAYIDILNHLNNDAVNTNYTSVHMTSNMSRPMKWFEEQYVPAVKNFHRASITASCHREHVDTDKKVEDFADKLVLCQEYDTQITINMVMVPEQFNEIYDLSLYFHNRGINVTLKPQSDPTASKVVDGYTPEMLAKLHNGMPQRAYTEEKALKSGLVKRPKPTFMIDKADTQRKKQVDVDPHYQIEFVDKEGKPWFMDQAERFNAFNFNNFHGWECSSGYRSIIIREPDGTVKRSYSCSEVPLGHIETGFKLYDKPMPCGGTSCVSSADSKIPKRAPGTKLPLFPGDTSYV
jgi:MoaA/NifB/PqqE/SkfB family radical SAM enzyme